MLLCWGIATVILSLAQGQDRQYNCDDGRKLFEEGRSCIKAFDDCIKPWEKARVDCLSPGKTMCDFENEKYPICVDTISNGIKRQKAADAHVGPKEDASKSGNGHYIYVQDKTEFEFQIKDVNITQESCLTVWSYHSVDSTYQLKTGCDDNPATWAVYLSKDVNNMWIRNYFRLHFDGSRPACHKTWTKIEGDGRVDFLAVDNIKIWSKGCADL